MHDVARLGRLLLLAVALSAAACRGLDLDDVDDAFALTTKVFEYVSKSWEIVDKVEEHVGHDNTPLVWFAKKRERSILNNFGHITHMVRMTQKQNDEIRSITLGSLKKLQSLPGAVLNGIQVNELLESVRSIENDFKTMEGMCCCLRVHYPKFPRTIHGDGRFTTTNKRLSIPFIRNSFSSLAALPCNEAVVPNYKFNARVCMRLHVFTSDFEQI